MRNLEAIQLRNAFYKRFAFDVFRITVMNLVFSKVILIFLAYYNLLSNTSQSYGIVLWCVSLCYLFFGCLPNEGLPFEDHAATHHGAFLSEKREKAAQNMRLMFYGGFTFAISYLFML